MSTSTVKQLWKLGDVLTKYVKDISSQTSIRVENLYSKVGEVSP